MFGFLLTFKTIAVFAKTEGGGESEFSSLFAPKFVNFLVKIEKQKRIETQNNFVTFS